MPTFFPRALALASILAVGHASASLTLFSRDDFRGAQVSLSGPAPDFRIFDFNDRTSSVIVDGQPWEVCQDVAFRSRCVVLTPGQYPNLKAVGLDDRLSSARPAAVQRAEPPPPPRPESADDIVFFEDRGFHGRSVGVSSEVRDFRRGGYNDQASSVIVFEGRWEACEHADFGGRCVLLRPGRYPDLAAMGLNDQLSSVRRLRRDERARDERDERDAQAPLPAYDWRRRPSDVLVQVPVETVRAVYATPQQHCWVEQAPRSNDQRAAGAVIGGVIGGILGHQIGEGGNRDVLTAGGAIAGAVIGAQVARGNESQPVTRCQQAAPTSQRPDFYDVTYRFKGAVHHIQSTVPPGPTLLVNGEGEPRL
jgi:uncharacterized protein YcfJ